MKRFIFLAVLGFIGMVSQVQACDLRGGRCGPDRNGICIEGVCTPVCNARSDASEWCTHLPKLCPQQAEGEPSTISMMGQCWPLCHESKGNETCWDTNPGDLVVRAPNGKVAYRLNKWGLVSYIAPVTEVNATATIKAMPMKQQALLMAISVMETGRVNRYPYVFDPHYHCPLRLHAGRIYVHLGKYTQTEEQIRAKLLKICSSKWVKLERIP